MLTQGHILLALLSLITAYNPEPDDFNFVAIRDRIRCYYKSYVQTARKRGLKLPEKKQVKAKVSASTDQKKE